MPKSKSGNGTRTGRRKRSNGKRAFAASTFQLNGTWPGMNPEIRTGMKVYDFQQTFTYTNYQTSSTTLETFGNHQVQLANYANATTFGSLFDQYRIALVEAWFIPRFVPVGTNNNTGRFVSVVDYDDTNNLTTTAEAMEYDTAMVSSGSAGHYRRFVPMVNNPVQVSGGGFTASSSKPAPWVDIASTNILHYGLKTAWTVTDAAYTYDLVVRITIQCRGVR